MTRLDKFKDWLVNTCAHPIAKPIEPRSLNMIMATSALRLGIKAEEVKVLAKRKAS